MIADCTLGMNCLLGTVVESVICRSSVISPMTRPRSRRPVCGLASPDHGRCHRAMEARLRHWGEMREDRQPAGIEGRASQRSGTEAVCEWLPADYLASESHVVRLKGKGAARARVFTGPLLDEPATAPQQEASHRDRLLLKGQGS